MSKQSLLLGALAMGCALLPGATHAQYGNAPFFENPVAVSQAYGIEALALRLDLATAFSPPYDDELAETIGGVTGPDYARFAGTLAQRDPALAEELATALAAVSEAAEEGEDAAEPVAAARELLAQAYDAVIAEDLQGSSAFKGAVMINLLLAEGGVAEGYEEAVENQEPWEYPSGWAALQRVKTLWSEVAEGTDGQHKSDGDDMLALLDTLYPQATPPQSVAGLNPEEAESPSQRLGGILETVVDADLYPGRDLPGLAEHLGTVTQGACSAYAEQPEVASETIYAVHDLYAAHLAEVAVLFAPEAEEKAGALFASLIGAGEDDDDEGEEAQDEGNEDDATAIVEDEDDAVETGAAASDACSQLSAVFVDIKTALGG